MAESVHKLLFLITYLYFRSTNIYLLLPLTDVANYDLSDGDNLFMTDAGVQVGLAQLTCYVMVRAYRESREFPCQANNISAK